MRTVLRPRWEQEVLRVQKVTDATEALAEAVAEEAQVRAPKDTGAGAASIHAEPLFSGVGFRVSWDREHDYMRFPEFGTVHMTARPFLRPAVAAAAAQRTIN